MLQFRFLGIPVQIQPLFWLMAFLIGGGFHIEGRESLIAVVLGMAVIFVSILVHELGHALTSRKLTGVNPSIQLVPMGGLAFPNTQLTNKQSFWVTWAGPLAGFALFLVTLLGLIIAFGPSSALHFCAVELFPGVTPDLRILDVLIGIKLTGYHIISTLLFVNFWWSILNLLPVFPLDGGQIYASIEPSRIKVIKVGLITGIAAAAAFLVFGRPVGAILFGFLAFENYQRLQQMTGGRR